MSYPLPDRPNHCLDDFIIGESIGCGNFSIVEIAFRKEANGMRGKQFAIKTYDKLLLQKRKKVHEAFMEKHILSRLCHKNIIRLVSTFSSPSHAYLVTELCVKGELWRWCRGWGHPERLAKIFLKQIAEAVQYLHRAGIVHRDIKTENIFVCEDFTVKLGDFGTATDLLNPLLQPVAGPSIRKSHEFFVGTPNFMAPEAIANQMNDQISDIWSFGCTAYQLLLGIPPFLSSSDYFTFLRVEHRDLSFPANSLSACAEEFLNSIIRIVRSERLIIEEILEHPFLRLKSSSAHSYTDTEISVMDLCENMDKEDFMKSLDGSGLKDGDPETFKRIVWGQEWRDKSKPGSGAASLVHLQLPELADDYEYLKQTRI
jgi:serine/threonine protein kinase